MSRQQLLEEKLRKSEVLTEEGVFADFMQYASGVRDEMEVYLYMEENQIGLDHADYWVARFNVLQRQCEFVQLAALIRKAKAIEGLQQKWKIEQFEKQVINLMEKLLFSRFRGKRRSDEFMRMDPSRVHEERRKIGNIEIYIDESCRMNYRLEDYSKFIEERLQDHCCIERESYKREQRRKEPSFIAKKEMDFIEMTQQIFAQTNRRSRGSVCAAGPRLSTKNRTSQVQRYDDEVFNTPKNNQNKPETNKRMSIFQDNKQKGKCQVSRDSVEILKSMKGKVDEKHQDLTSPRFNETPRAQGQMEEQPEATQVCRASQVMERNPFTAYSFGKNTKLIFQEKKIEYQLRIAQLEQPVLDDNAFLLHSFGQEDHLNQKNDASISKDDFELELIIHETQRETYDLADSKTFSSEIDSNQENKEYIDLGLPRQPDYNRVRRPFEVLHETEPQSKDFGLEELVHLDEDEKNPESKGYQTDVENYKSNHKRSAFRESIFRSEREKRLSNISEEGSCYYSETKHVRSH